VDDQVRKEHAQKLIEHLVHQVIRRPGLQITEDSPLVSSGLIDSLALVQILMKVEDVTERRIPAGKVQPKDMDTVSLMLATAERVGTPRKQ
jgi:acyl carrier protein